MSFTERVSRLGKDLGGAALAPFKLVWDISTSPFNDDEEFNGVANTLKTSVGNFVKSVARPIGDVLSDINALNQTLIREPLDTVALAAWQSNPLRGEEGVGISNFFKEETWQKAWDARDEVSLGQAVAANIFSNTLSRRLFVDETKGANLFNEFDIFNEEQRNQVFKKSLFGRLSSGSLDFTAQLFGDVTLIGGKFARAAYLGKKGINALERLTPEEMSLRIKEATDGIIEAQKGFADGVENVNLYSKAIRDFRDNGVAYAYSRDFVKSSDQPDILAWLLGNAKTDDEVAYVMRSALGDPDAYLEFAKLRPSNAAALSKSLGELNAVDKHIIAPPVDPRTGQIRIWENPKVLEEADLELKDLMDNDQFFQKFKQIATDPLTGKVLERGEGRIVTRTFGSERFQAFEDFLAKGRALRFYGKQGKVNPTIEVYQPTRWNRAYARITWAAGERPAFIANLNESDSYQEMLAAVNRALKVVGGPKGKLAGFTADDATRFLNEYASATTAEQRGIVIYKLEETVVKKLSEEFNITPQRATEIYNIFGRSRQSALQTFKDRGYALDLDGTTILAPLFESQTANQLPIMDFDTLRRALGREQSVLQGPLALKDSLVDLADVMQDLFKIGTLLRLGYTMRNAVDSQLRIMASYGPFVALKSIPQGVSNFITNAKSVPPRLVDNVKIWTKGETVRSRRLKIDKEAKEVGLGIGLAEKSLKSIDDEIARIEAGPVITPYKSSTYDDAQLEAIKFGNDQTVKRILMTQADNWVASPAFKNETERIWQDTFVRPNDQKIMEIEALIKSPVMLAKFRNTGMFPKSILQKFIKEVDPRTGARRWKKGTKEWQKNYDIEDVYALLKPNTDEAQRAIGAGDIEMMDNFIDWYPSKVQKARFTEERIKNVYDEYDDPQAIADLRTYIAEEEASHIAKIKQNWNPDTSELYGKKEILQGALLEDRLKYDDLLNQLEKIDRPRVTKTIGQEDIVTVGAYGNYVTRGSAGKGAELKVRDVSNAKTNQAQISGFPYYMSKNLEYMGRGTVTPDMPYYHEEWASVLNNVYKNSEVAKYLIRTYLRNGKNWQAALDDTQSWMLFGKGKEVAKRISPQVVSKELPTYLGLAKEDIPGYISKVGNYIRTTIPRNNEDFIMQRIADNKIVSSAELRRAFPNTDELPAISGRILEDDFTNNIGKAFNKWVDKFFNVLGTIPEDKWARYPLYDNLYRDMLKKRILSTELLQGKKLDEAALSRIMEGVHTQALREVRKVLYTVMRRSNVGAQTVTRLMSPFFGAQENAYKTWIRLIGRNPVIINRAQLIWTAPNRAGFVTDKDGNPIEQDELTYDGTIWLEVPKPLQKLPGLTSLTTLGIPMRSLDIVLGGGFELPVGPYVAIPASEIVKRKPELEDALNFVLPYGPERNAAMAMLPTWLKRQIVKTQGQDSPEFARMYQLIWTTEQHKARENGTPYKTPQEIEKMVKAFYNMRTVANLVLPFAPRFDSPYRMYMDKWREYQRTYGKNADDMFLKDYPEYFDFAISLSQNVGGVQASVDTVKAIKANKDLVAELYATEPALIGLVVNNPTGYDFSQAAYEWEYATPVAPGTKQTFRGTSDPVEVQKKNEAKKGWIQYRQFMSTQIEPVLADRGLSSVRDRRAKDLAAMRDDFITKLGQSNIAWQDDWLDTDGSKTNRVIRGLKAILENEKFIESNADNPTWKSVAMYLSLREEVAAELDKRKVKSLRSKANVRLAEAFDAAVGQLKQQDIGFSDLYDRFLSNDLVYDKFAAGANEA